MLLFRERSGSALAEVRGFQATPSDAPAASQTLGHRTAVYGSMPPTTSATSQPVPVGQPAVLEPTVPIMHPQSWQYQPRHAWHRQRRHRLLLDRGTPSGMRSYWSSSADSTKSLQGCWPWQGGADICFCCAADCSWRTSTRSSWRSARGASSKAISRSWPASSWAALWGISRTAF